MSQQSASLKTMLSQPQPVAAYDASQQKLVMIFDSLSLAERYIFNSATPSKNAGARIRNYLTRKTRIDSRFGRPLAVRYAAPAQAAMIPEGKKMLILDYHFHAKTSLAIESGIRPGACRTKPQEIRRQALDGIRKSRRP